jgi:hypothetical protein
MHLRDLLVVFAALAAWLLVSRYVLPRLGIHT